MPKIHKALIGVAAAASFAALAGTGLAQQARTPEREGPPPGRGGERSDPAKHAERLRQILRLTPGQEPAFQAWLAATAPKPRGQQPDRREPRAATTPERLDRQLAMAAERHAAFKVRADATKRFYGALTAEQKTVFDALPPQLALGLGRHGGHGRKMMHGRQGGGRGQWERPG